MWFVVCIVLAVLLLFVYSCFYLSGKLALQEERFNAKTQKGVS